MIENVHAVRVTFHMRSLQPLGITQPFAHTTLQHSQFLIMELSLGPLVEIFR